MASSVRSIVGTVITTGIPGTELDPSTRRVLERLAPGGVILFRRNVVNADQLRQLVTDLHSLPSRPLVSIDHEGGPVLRVDAPFTQFPAAAHIGRADTTDLSFAVGRAMGTELASVGIDIDFAPVLDVHSNPHNPIIGERAFAATPGAVARLALAFQRGLHSAGVLACGKHFPGHGDTDQDSHKDLPVVTRSRDELEACELTPFRVAATVGMPMLMTAHVLYPALDDTHPATLSKAILGDLLRRDLGFRGIVVSDDLEMRAISSHHRIEDAALGALRAGVDWLLICNDLDLSLAVALRIERAMQTGDLEEEIVRRAALRIRALRTPPRTKDLVPLPVAQHETLNAHLRRYVA